MINRGNVYNRYSIRKRSKCSSKQMELLFMPKKLSSLYYTKKQLDSMTFLQLVNHYNFIVATALEQLGKVNVNDHAYLTELKMKLENHPFNPQNLRKV